MRLHPVLTAVALVVVVVSSVGAQQPSHAHHTAIVDTSVATVAEFLTRARAGAAPFADRAAAVAAGYRRLGPDFPFGAEHWVNPRLMADDAIVAERPEVLLYVPTPSGPSLVGVAYVLPREPHEPTPDFPAPAAFWHDHWSSVDEEVARSHDHMAAAAPTAEPRVAMLHLWLFATNPEGVFALEHRGLPLLRLGIASSASDHGAIGWMGALAHGAAPHFASLLRTELRVDEVAARTELERYATSAAALFDAARTRARLDEDAATALLALAGQLTAELERRYGARAPSVAGAPR
jgi:hypothetical protein